MVYLLFGEDEYLRNEYLKKIKKAFGDMQLVKLIPNCIFIDAGKI